MMVDKNGHELKQGDVVRVNGHLYKVGGFTKSIDDDRILIALDAIYQRMYIEHTAVERIDDHFFPAK